MEPLLYCALAFGPLAFGCIDFWSVSILEALLLGLALLGLRRRPLLDSPADKTLLPAFLGVIAIGLIQLPFTVSPSATLRALPLWSAYACLLWASPRALDSRATLRRAAWAVLFVGIAVALIGIWQIEEGLRRLYGFRELGIYDQPFGSYSNRNHAASLLMMSTLVGCGLFLSGFVGRARPKIGSAADFASRQIFLLVLIGVLIYGLLQSQSRAGLHALMLFFGLGVFLTITAALRAGSLRSTGLVFFAITAGLYILFIRYNPRYVHFFSLGYQPEGSAAVRLSIYRSAWRMFQDRPLLGFGLGAAMKVFPAYQDPSIGAIAHIHNDWLELLVDTGVLGLSCYAVGLFLFARRVVRAIRRIASEETGVMATWVFCASGAFAFHGLVDFNFQIPGNAVVFLILLSWLGAFAGLPE